jgi:hypothetical protein
VARPKINISNPELKFAEIAKLLGEQWKSMDAVTRQTYEVGPNRYRSPRYPMHIEPSFLDLHAIL